MTAQRKKEGLIRVKSMLEGIPNLTISYSFPCLASASLPSSSRSSSDLDVEGRIEYVQDVTDE
jgi:hypothetical protein